MRKQRQEVLFQAHLVYEGETDSTDFVHNDSCFIRYQRVSIAAFLLIFWHVLY